MGVLAFSFLIPVNYLHGSSQASPAGRTTERRQGPGRRDPVWQVWRVRVQHLGASGFPSVRPSFRSVSAKIPLEVHGSERAYCSVCIVCLALIATCVLGCVATALAVTFADSSPCATVWRDSPPASLSLSPPCDSAILISQIGKLPKGVESCDFPREHV